MPRILFIAAHRPNRSPSQRFRFEQYMELLREHGYECELSYLISDKDDQVFYSPGNYFTKFRVWLQSAFTRLADARAADQYDIVFVQREAFMTGSTYFEKRFSRSRAKLVFDFDDAIWLHDVSPANRKLGWLKRPDKTADIIGIADLVIVGNSYLAKYAARFNDSVAVIPTTIDTAYHQRVVAKTQEHPLIIGWTGTATTLRHFEIILPVYEFLKNKYGEMLQFRIIVDVDYSPLSTVNLEVKQWNLDTEIADLCAFDIGVMPLPDDEWAIGKCGFKGLQYMALEIPAVVSPVGVNTEIIEDGRNGFHATKPEEWIDKLSRLIESEDLRTRMGVAGRVTVKEQYSVDAQKDNYLKYLGEVLEK